MEIAADIAELKRRVSALEEARDVTANDIAGIKRDLRKLAIVTDTLREMVDGLTTRIAALELEFKAFREETRTRFDRIEAEQVALRRDLPSIIAETVRDVLRESRG